MPPKLFSQKRKKLLAALAVCILLIYLNPRGIFNPLRSVFLRISYPFQKTFYLLSGQMREAVDFAGSISELRRENEGLIRENNQLLSEVTSLKDEKNQNKLLREQLGLIPKNKFDLEASFVVGKNPQRFENWITIDKGKNFGISEGMPVIVSNGILVGKIYEVYGNTSRVKPLTDSSSVVNVIDIETEAKGVIKGEYGLGTILDLISQTDIINKGDSIVTSGLGGDFPRGLSIGKIQEVKSTGDKLFQQAIVMPTVNYSKLDVVFVVKNQEFKK